MERFNIRANIETKIADIITFGTQTYGTKEFKDPGSTSMTYLLQAWPGMTPIYNGKYGASEHPEVTQKDNILQQVAYQGGQNTYTRLNTTWYANIELPLKGLVAEAKFNWSQYSRHDEHHSQNLPRYSFRESFDTPKEGIGVLDQATTYRYAYESTSYTADLLLRYNNTFGKHDVGAFFGYEQYRGETTGFSAEKKGLIDWSITDITSGAEMNSIGGSAKSVNAIISYFGRINYAYNGKYLLEASFRSDASSKFAPGHRSSFFPSGSAAWRISEEACFEPLKNTVNSLKIRASYGSLGNTVGGNYDWQALYKKVNNVFDERVQNGLIQSSIQNLALSWEKVTTYNFGLDASFLNQRLTLEADFYLRKTSDILTNSIIYKTMGSISAPMSNTASLTNHGFEFNLGWNESLNKDLSYGVSFLGTYNKNEVVEMGAESQVITGGTIHGGTYTSRTLAGYPIGGFWLIPTDGYFNSTEEVQAHQKDGVLIQPSAEPGDIRFKDTNNDGTINDEDRVYCGSPFPKFTYSINGNITYKNVDFSIGFQGVTGNKIYNATKLELTDVTRGTNYLASTLDYWTPENQNASSPRLIWTDPNRNARSESDRYLESGSYFRLRNLQVGYTLPTVWFHGFVQKARVYVNAENLFTISSYSGYTPDVNSSDVYSRGFDEFIYPSNRTFMFGLNVTF